MRTGVAAFLIFFLFSCSSSKHISGVYYRKFETLTLNKDSTFDYNYRHEQPLYVAKGTWELSETNKIHLKSTYNPDSLPVTVKESNSDSKGVTIIIEAQDSVQLSYMKDNLECIYLINGIGRGKQKFEPFSTDSNLVINSIEIVFNYIYSDKIPSPNIVRHMLKTKKYVVKDARANLFRITIPLHYEMFYSVTVDDMLDILRGKNLLWPKKGEPYFNKIKEIR